MRRAEVIKIMKQSLEYHDECIRAPVPGKHVCPTLGGLVRELYGEGASARYDCFVMGVWAFWIGELQGGWWRRFTVEGRAFWIGKSRMKSKKRRWKRDVKLSGRW